MYELVSPIKLGKSETISPNKCQWLNLAEAIPHRSAAFLEWTNALQYYTKSVTQARQDLGPRISISKQRSQMKHFGSRANSELIMFCRVQTGFDEDSLHGFPIVVVVGSRHAMDLPLASDGVAVLLPRDGQEHVGPHVLEAHGILPLPVSPTALHNPEIQVISFTIIPKGTYFLLRDTSFLKWKCERTPPAHTNINHRLSRVQRQGWGKKCCCSCFALSTVTKARSSKMLPLQFEHEEPTNSNL